MKKIIVPEISKKLVFGSYRKDYSPISANWEAVALETLDQKKFKERALLLKGIRPKGGNVLEIGSGAGSLLAQLSNLGFNCYGLEPEKDLFKAAQELFQANKLDCKIFNQGGEEIPFGDKFFDLIVSFQVIEHVQDIQKVFNETARTLKDDGEIYFVIPNYFSFWEGHYGLFWLPLFPKLIASLYLRMKKKDPAFLMTLNYITPFNIRSYCRKSKLEITNLGENIWLDRMRKADFNAYAHTGVIKKAVKTFKNLKINTLVARIGLILNMYYPIILRATKKTNKSID